jgi:hypothetical protein
LTTSQKLRVADFAGADEQKGLEIAIALFEDCEDKRAVVGFDEEEVRN